MSKYKIYKHVTVTYDINTHYLYIDDSETDEQLEVFYVNEED